MPSTISPRVQAKEMAKREEAERQAKAERERKRRPNKRSATSPPRSSTATAARAAGVKRRKLDTIRTRSPARKSSSASKRHSGKIKQEGVEKRPLPTARKGKGRDRGEQKRGTEPRQQNREQGRKVADVEGTERGKGKGRTAQSPKGASTESRKALRKTAGTTLKGKQGKSAKAKTSAAPNTSKSPALKAKGTPRGGAGGRRASRAVAPLSSNFRKALSKGPGAKQRRLFKLSKSLLPLGIWPSASGETFDLASEWKAGLLKRYENPPAYRKLKANLYPDSSWRGLVPVDEIPLCHCHAEDGCDAGCINRLLLMECAPGRCPTLRGGTKHCENNAIQTKTFPRTEIFRTFEGRGWGLRLSDERGAAAGTLLHEYLGEVITMDECRKRLRKVGRKGAERSSSDFYFASLDGNLVLDGGPMGSEARFANHSCSPNCLLQKWSVLGETRVVLVAARDLSPGEELTYNYQADTLEGFVERQKCLCGEPQCSGFIGGELVAVKAEEWQRRASKVMSQVKPQLEVVRELFQEGQELGYEQPTEDQAGPASTATTRFQGREMECLSIMCKEGDEWLEQLADVMEGRTAAVDDIAAAAAAAATAEATATATANGSAASTAAAGKPPSGDEPPRRTSSRAGRGVRKRYEDSDSDTDAGGNSNGRGKVKGEESPTLPPKVDLVALEKVLERAPAGLHIPEAIKAKKTVARASQIARTVWVLLDAASKNGLEGVKVPAERQPPQEPPFPHRQQQLAEADRPAPSDNETGPGPSDSSENDDGGGAVTGDRGRARRGRGGRGGRGGTRATGRGGGGRCASGTRGSRGNSGDSSGAAELSSGDGDGDSREVGVEGVGEEGEAQRADDDLLLAGAADLTGGVAMDVCDGGADAAAAVLALSGEGDGAAGLESGGGRLLPPAADISEKRGESQPEADPALGGDAGTSRMAPMVPYANGGSKKGSPGEAIPAATTATAATATAAPRAAAVTSAAALQPAPESKKKLSGRDVVVPVCTRRSSRRSSSSAACTALPEDKKTAPPPPSMPSQGAKAEEGSLALPTKPKMTQVYQAIRSCKGLAPVFIPGASELEKLVAPAEAWAREACIVLKIKVPEASAIVDGKGKECAEDEDRDNAGEDKEKSKWEKLGLDGSAMTALEEKLQEVAEFSLAREQREEEIEKERLLKEKAAAKEQRERQARLHRLAKRLKRRNRSKGSGPVPPAAEHGNASCDGVAGVDKILGASGEASGEDAMAWEARRSPRIISLDSACDGTGSAKRTSILDNSTAEGAADESNGDGEAGAGVWTKEDEVELHCLCRLPADTARFRTLMTCDLCHSWFHPACVRLKELPENQLRGRALAFVCPMCEHGRGGVSNFACPPSPGFYIGRRMHRPGLEELEALMKHAESLPVDGVDGQAYLSYIVEQVAGWRDRCHAVVQDVQAYIQNGHTRSFPSGRVPSLAAEAPTALSAPVEESSSNGTTEDIEATVQGLKGTAKVNGAVAVGGRERADDPRFDAVSRGENGPAGPPTRPGTAGVVLSSVGRDLGYEAALVERLGRLACEGVLIEVVDVHKEDMMLRRSLWVLTASLCFPSVAACLRVGQEPGLVGTLSPDDEEMLRSNGLSEDSAARLRPTFETLEASLTEGRTLGLSRHRSSQHKSKIRRGSAGAATSGQHHTSGGGGDREKASKEQRSRSCSDSGACAPVPALPLTTSSSTSSRTPSPDERPSSDPLGAGVRVYTRLFDLVGDIIQAVVKSEAKPFREARNFLPDLKAATRWAAIEQSWGYSRALASELAWRREVASRSSTAMGATATDPATETGTATTAVAGKSAAAMTSDSTAVEASPVGEALVGAPRAAASATAAAAATLEGGEDEHDETDVYCICREGDDGGVMVECDVCSEWYHASCVGLTEVPEDELQQYQCLVCCETKQEKCGHYKHRWTTNVAVEASVRRLTPRRTSNSTISRNLQSQTSLPGQTAQAASRCRISSARRAASCGAIATNFADGDDVPGRAASPSDGHRPETARRCGMDKSETSHDSNECVGSTDKLAQLVEPSASPANAAASADLSQMVSCGDLKRLPDEHSRQVDLPGAKRSRATAMVAGYVERHYADLGIPPPERPSSPKGAPVDHVLEDDDASPRSEQGAADPERARNLPVVEAGKAGESWRRSGVISDRQGYGTEATDKYDGQSVGEPSHLALRVPLLLASEDLAGGQLITGCSSTGSGSDLGQGALDAHSAPRQGGHRHVYLHEHHQYQRSQQQHLRQHLQNQVHQERQSFQGQEQTGPSSWTQSTISLAQGFPAFASPPVNRGEEAASVAGSLSALSIADPAAPDTPGPGRAPSSPRADAISQKEVAGGEETDRAGMSLENRAAAPHTGGIPPTIKSVLASTSALSSHGQRAEPVAHRPPPPPGH